MTPWITKPVPFNIGQGAAAGAGGGGFSDDTDLKAYYKFSQLSGDIINSSEATASLGSAADLQVTGGTYNQDVAPFNYSLQFDGIDDFCEAGTSASQFNFLHNGEKSSIVYWVRYQGTIDTNEMILDNHDKSDESGKYGLDIRGTGTDAYRYMISKGVANEQVVQADTTSNYIPDNTTTYMYAWTWDESLGSANLKVTRDAANGENFNKDQSSVTNDATRPLIIGARSGGTTGFLEAYLAEMSIWNRILSPTEITELYNGGNGLALY